MCGGTEAQVVAAVQPVVCVGAGGSPGPGPASGSVEGEPVLGDTAGIVAVGGALAVEEVAKHAGDPLSRPNSGHSPAS
jgi:hypothetical protein